MPASDVTTIPTATTEGQERGVYAVPLSGHRGPAEVCKCWTREDRRLSARDELDKLDVDRPGPGRQA